MVVGAVLAVLTFADDAVDVVAGVACRSLG
jgi:hypothetical protein